MDFQQPNQQQPDQQQVNQQPEPSIQPTSPVVNQPPKNTWKVVALAIAGVLVLGGASYGAYYYWQNNKTVVAPIDETANWQTYKNDEYGFEVKYPKSWEYQEVTTEIGPVQGAIGFKPKDKSYSYSPGTTIGHMDLVYVEISTGTPEQIFGEIYPGLATGIRKTINNYSAWFLDNALGEKFYVFENPTKQNMRITLRNEIDMLVKTNNLEKDELNNVFNQILSTFKFTK